MTNAKLDARVNGRDIDAILTRLPRLQVLDPNSAAKWPAIHQTGEREFEIDRGKTHPLIVEFIKALYEHGLIRDFDWGSWQPNALRFINHPELLGKASMKTCIKLLTLHARKDRFVDCHFAGMVRSGHIQAILARMAELRKNAGEGAKAKKKSSDPRFEQAPSKGGSVIFIGAGGFKPPEQRRSGEPVVK